MTVCTYRIDLRQPFKVSADTSHSAATPDGGHLFNESSIKITAPLAWTESRDVDLLTEVNAILIFQDGDSDQVIGSAEKQDEDLLLVTVYVPWRVGELIFQALNLGKSEMLAFVGEDVHRSRAEISGLWMSDFSTE
jgi:hypothetical protein